MPAETLSPPRPKAERRFGRERLTQQEMRQQFAAIAILAILMAAYGSAEKPRDSQDQAKTPRQERQATPRKPESRASWTAPPQAELFTLLNKAMGGRRIGDYRGAYDRTKTAPADIRYSPASFSSNIIPPPTPQSDFRPAPTMSETPLGPQMPNLAFNDRVRPTSKRPSQADFAASERANSMYQRELLRTGWHGGEATPQQHKHAARAIAQAFHPDRPGTAAEDVAAFQAFNAQHSTPEAKAQMRARAAAQEAPVSSPSPSGESATDSQPSAAGNAPSGSESAPSSEAPSDGGTSAPSGEAPSGGTSTTGNGTQGGESAAGGE